MQDESALPGVLYCGSRRHRRPWEAREDDPEPDRGLVFDKMIVQFMPRARRLEVRQQVKCSHDTDCTHRLMKQGLYDSYKVMSRAVLVKKP